MWSDLILTVLHCPELNCQLSGKNLANTGDVSIGWRAEIYLGFFVLSRLVLHFYYRILLELKLSFRMKLVQVFGSKLKAHKSCPLATALVLPLFRCSCWNWFSSEGITWARPNPTLSFGTTQSQISSPLQPLAGCFHNPQVCSCSTGIRASNPLIFPFSKDQAQIYCLKGRSGAALKHLEPSTPEPVGQKPPRLHQQSKSHPFLLWMTGVCSL